MRWKLNYLLEPGVFGMEISCPALTIRRGSGTIHEGWNPIGILNHLLYGEILR